MRGLAQKASILVALSLGACLWTLDEQRINEANSRLDGSATEGKKALDSGRGGTAGDSDASSTVGSGGQTGTGGSGKGGSLGTGGSSGSNGSGGTTGGAAGIGGSSGGSGGSSGANGSGTSGAGGSADSGSGSWHCNDSGGGCTCTKSGTGPPSCTVQRTCCYLFVFASSDACQCANDDPTNCTAKAKAVNGSVVSKCPP